jgi:hypothetical protein
LTLKNNLGKLVLVGTIIPPANARFRVVANNSTSASPTGTADQSVVAGPQPTSIKVTGTGLTGVTVMPTPAGVTASAPGGGTDTSLPLTITALTSQSFKLQLQRPDGSIVTVPINVQGPTLKAAANSPPVKVGANQMTITSVPAILASTATVTSDDATVATVSAATSTASTLSFALTILKKPDSGTLVLHVLPDPSKFPPGDQGFEVDVKVP